MRFAVVSVAGDHDHAEHVGRFGGVDELSACGFAREGADRVVILAACPFGEEFQEVPRDAFARDVWAVLRSLRVAIISSPLCQHD